MDLFNNLISVHNYKDNEILNQINLIKINNEDQYSKLNKRLDNFQYIQISIIFVFFSLLLNKILTG